jgi:hypothetical protein
MKTHALGLIAALVLTSGLANAQSRTAATSLAAASTTVGDLSGLSSAFGLLPPRAWSAQSGLQLPQLLNEGAVTSLDFFSRGIATKNRAYNSGDTLSTLQITRSFYVFDSMLMGVGFQANALTNTITNGLTSDAPFAARSGLASAFTPAYALTANVSRPFATPLGALALRSGFAIGTARPAAGTLAQSLNQAQGSNGASRTVWQGGIDAALRFSAKSSVGLGYSVESALEPGAAPQRNLSASYGYQPTPSVKLLVNLSRDMSKAWSEPAVGLSAGVSLRYSY